METHGPCSTSRWNSVAWKPTSTPGGLEEAVGGEGGVKAWPALTVWPSAWCSLVGVCQGPPVMSDRVPGEKVLLPEPSCSLGQWWSQNAAADAAAVRHQDEIHCQTRLLDCFASGRCSASLLHYTS